ncbi:MFS transporter [Flavobacterium sp. CYK-4]|uniref:MFS transporter n=1 Tax=Flavobacterium lotistagni TaxID=2709660 RepID=UPI00140B8140|nr:MFS transporter [Flavobacterium lotistagni]NHM06818.1 MFS transporter [Flavobacterium lotistagni]
MENQSVHSRERVPLIQKAAFGAGHLVNNLLPGALSVFSFFLLTAFGMDPFLAGILGGLPRIYDAILDPIIGHISDNTKSKWGRRRPYIFVGAILSGLLFAVLWQLDPKATQMYNFWYFLIFSLIFLTGNAIFATPLIGLGYEMTSDYNERTRLMGFSQTVGQIAWMIVPWFWVIIADPDMFPSQAEGVHYLAIIVGVICLILGILPALFCREIDLTNLENKEPVSASNLSQSFVELFRSIKQIIKNKPFLKLCAATFLVFNGFQMVASFSYFIIVFYLFNGDYGMAGTWPAWFSTISAVFTAFLIIPIVTMISNRFGKKNAFIISTILSIIGYGLKWWGFSPDNLWLMFIPLPLISFGLGGLFTLMMSMTADVCDLDELENGMPRKEGTFGAIYWWMVKLGQGIALVLAGWVLEVIGFDAGNPIQTQETITNLRLFDIFIPIITAAIAIWVMWDYNLSEDKAKAIKDELVARRGEL